MDGLKINYSETISVGNQVTEKGGEFQELLNKVKATNSELKHIGKVAMHQNIQMQ